MNAVPERRRGQDPEWRNAAACRGLDTDLFFPISEHGPGGHQTRRAKAVCARCPVTEQCLSWAVRTAQRAGIWGGCTTEERRALNRVGARTAG